jgi:hypothetical protein
MADPLKPIERESTKVSLEERYKKSSSDLGLGAKNAGAPTFKATDLIDVGNTNQDQFKVKAQQGVTTYTERALNFAVKNYKINTNRYFTGGIPDTIST